MSLTLVTYVSKGSLIGSLMMACVGLILCTVGLGSHYLAYPFYFDLKHLRTVLNLSM